MKLFEKYTIVMGLTSRLKEFEKLPELSAVDVSNVFRGKTNKDLVFSVHKITDDFNKNSYLFMFNEKHKNKEILPTVFQFSGMPAQLAFNYFSSRIK